MKKVLVIGATGFIGRTIVPKLIQEGCQVILLGRDLEKIPKQITDHSKVVVLQHCLSQYADIERAIVTYGITDALHLVSSLIPSSTIEDFAKEFEQVITPTFKLIDFFCEHRIRLHYFSSGGTVYGRAEGLISECHALSPITHYGVSKQIIEDYIRLKGANSQLQYIILRPSNVYGPLQRCDGRQGFVGAAVLRLLQDVPIEIWGNGNVVRDYLHVDDLCDVVCFMINSSITGEIFNVGSGVGVSLLEVVNLIEGRLEKKAMLEFKEGRREDVPSIVLNIKKLKIVMPFAPRKLADGLDFIKQQQK